MAGIAAMFGHLFFGLGPLLWPVLRMPYDETFPEAPTERLLLWICAVAGVAIGLAVFLALSRSRIRIGTYLHALTDRRLSRPSTSTRVP